MDTMVLGRIVCMSLLIYFISCRRVQTTEVLINECHNEYHAVTKISTSVQYPGSLKMYVKCDRYSQTSILLTDESGVPREYFIDPSKLMDTVQYDWYDRSCEISHKSKCEENVNLNVELKVVF